MKILPICPPHLSDVATLPREIQKVILTVFIHICDYLCYLRRKQTVIHLPTTWKCHHTSLRIAKLFHLTEGLLYCFKRLEPVVMCGNWNVGQTVSQQVFRASTLCVNICLQSFSTLIVWYTTLCWNLAHVAMSQLQASTCPYQYTRCCSVVYHAKKRHVLTQY